MVSGNRVLVATDLSAGGDEAVRQGDAWARADGGELILVHIVPNLLRSNPLFPQRGQAETAGLLDMEQAAARAVQERAEALTGREPGSLRVIIDNGAPDACIVEIAERVAATLVVVGSSGMTGLARLLLGNVALRVVRHAHAPVLVARPHAPTGKILVATDFSDPAVPAVDAAIAVARARGARPTLMHSVDVLPSHAIGFGAPFGAAWVVVPPEVIEEMRKNAASLLEEQLKRFQIDGDVHVALGNATAGIVKAAEDLPAELVVIGTRGRTGLARLTLGSVAEGVVRSASCSVLVVRFEAERAAQP
jgi:universal stress protein E